MRSNNMLYTSQHIVHLHKYHFKWDTHTHTLVQGHTSQLISVAIMTRIM